MLVWTWGS